ncbi:MAG: DNA ligase D [Gemmatimonadaceae bacterium]
MAGRSTIRSQLAEYRRKRDFRVTAEPSGDPPGSAAPRSAPARSGRAGALRFVVHKHAASHLHFDLRLEIGGTMKSWAVPKGPSLDPSVKRLAMEVEDHPIAYNAFEGTIPSGEYGGGTVMLWDRGTYEADETWSTALGADAGAVEGGEEALRRGHERGELKFTLHGERLRGSFALVRMKRPGRPQWLLIKHRDERAAAGSDIVADTMTSVATGRTMEEISAGQPARDPAAKPAAKPPAKGESARRSARPTPRRSLRPTTLEPMYATIGVAIPAGDGWTFEPKYDGIRVLAFATAERVHLMTRNGKDKATGFPEVVDALRALAAKHRRSVVLDGELVALTDAGEAARFQQLQSRMHVKDADDIAGHAERTPAALVAFDLLLDGDDSLLAEPWAARRKRLERVLRNRTSPRLRLSESIPNDGGEMVEHARTAGWEGVIAKRTDAPYVPGVRSRDWLKLKVEFRQEFVVGGFTEPRNTRQHLGALLLGYYDGDRFVYAGHAGGGFTREGLQAMGARLRPLERKTPAFDDPPKTNEAAHWVRPEVVVEVKFSEWTADGKLRQPIFLGVRDDKPARDVGREGTSVQRGVARQRTAGSTRTRVGTGPSAESLPFQLDVIEREGGDGTVRVARGKSLEVSSLDKVYFPKDKYTKGDIMRYYARVAPAILPALADRPLVLKRMPEGVNGETFFQQKPPGSAPDAVRVAEIETDAGMQERVIGGDVATLLYLVQLGCISMDPWHARVRSLESADYTVLDLDPGPRANFRRVVDVALAVRAELDALGLHAAPKTSGSRGIHIAVPLPARTSWETALVLAQLVATRVVRANPRIATVERTVSARAPGAVYVDYLQNVRGKSVAAAYCVRAKPGATASAPLDWSELGPDLDPRDFTIETLPARLAERGDLWAAAMARRNTLRTIRAVTSESGGPEDDTDDATPKRTRARRRA